MERRYLGVGLLALIGTLLMLVGTASAHSSLVKAAGTDPETEQAKGEAGCVVKTMTPSFIDQGEFGTSSSVADIVEVECNPEYAAESLVEINDHELYSQCGGRLSWFAPYELAGDGEEAEDALKAKGKKTKAKSKVKHNYTEDGPGVTVYTDNDGNATVVLLGGPGCTAGTSLITADLVETQYETVTTSFTVKGPKVTTPGLTLIPQTDIEDDFTSSAATIAEVEFPPVDAEKYVDINSPQLYNRCQYPDSPKLAFIGPDGFYAESGPDLSGKVQLDNDGNAFVVLVGSASCAAGPSLIEASLESKPYTTYAKDFTDRKSVV